MISVTTSNLFQSDRQNDAVQDPGVDNPSMDSVNGGEVCEEQSSKPESDLGLIEQVEGSIVYEELARVSNSSTCNDNNDVKFNSDVTLVIDSRVSDEMGVSAEVDKASDFRVCKVEGDHGIVENEIEKRGKAVESRNDKIEHMKSTSDYNSMLSMFDAFAHYGNNWAVGYGYEIGDMVWGKVKSHPWWPGHIYNEAFASASVRRSKTEGHVLVAFFGDSSYGWFDPAELIPFEPNFPEKSLQTSSRTFLKAVEEAIDEVSRRSALGLACRCRNPYNFRPMSVEGFFAVDVGGYEAGEIFSASQIKKARHSFQPQEMLAFVKQLALKPKVESVENINFIKRKASVLAYRKAIFEEFDETYAQAFGVKPERPEPKKASDLISKGPLSGRQVFQEALYKGKATGKPSIAKENEKDRYLFKRRDEVGKLKAQKATQVQLNSSGQHIQTDGSLSGKGMAPLLEDQVPRNNVSVPAEGFKQSSDQSGPGEVHPQSLYQPIAGDPMLHAEGSPAQSKVVLKKVKVNKRPAGELGVKDSVTLKKKKKKRKVEPDMQMNSDGMQMPAASGKVGSSVAKVAGKLVQVTPAAEGDSKVGIQEKEIGGKLDPFPSVAVGDPKSENEVKVDAASTSVMVPPQWTVGVRNTEVELRRLLHDLRALALDPFHVLENSSPLTLRKVFLKFRWLVYQKSLVLLEPNDTESLETHTGKSPAIAAPPDDPSVEYVKARLPVKQQKLSSRAEDPTIGGRKRAPSDRQEEIAAKKKKKVTDVKSLAAERRAAQKATEAPRIDTKEMSGKPSAPASKAARAMAVKKTVQMVKAPDPTMLIMKFQPGAALPSHAELKAKFARFGPLDPNKIRVFWQSYQCRLVYQHKSHAHAALNFATGNNSPFGSTKPRCYLRDLEAPESESAKVQREDYSFITSSQSRDPMLEQRHPAKPSPQLTQESLQLKSCLKRPPGEEGGSLNGNNGNGGGSSRGARVKFMLGGEETSRSEQLNSNNASFADGGASSSHAMDFNSKNFPSIVVSHPLTSSQLLSPGLPVIPKAELPQSSSSLNNMQHYNDASTPPVGIDPRNVANFNPTTSVAPPGIDITQQMLGLLTKCNDVVSNLSGLLGYVPYHPL